MWNQTTGNGLYNVLSKDLEDNHHHKKIKTMKTRVDNRPPLIPQHLQSKAKRRRLMEDRNTEIQEHNRMLLKKMLQIDLKPSPLNPASIAQTPLKVSLNRNFRTREAKKIADANRMILRRLKSTASVYNIRRWEDDRQYKVYLRENISRNSGRVRRPTTTKAANDEAQELLSNIMKRRGTRPMTASVGAETGGLGVMRPKTQGVDRGFIDN
jgi:hypothetical protein